MPSSGFVTRVSSQFNSTGVFVEIFIDGAPYFTRQPIIATMAVAAMHSPESSRRKVAFTADTDRWLLQFSIL